MKSPKQIAPNQWRVEWAEGGLDAIFKTRQQALAFKHLVVRPTLLPPLQQILSEHDNLWPVMGSALALIDRAKPNHNPTSNTITWQDGRMLFTVNTKKGTCSCKQRAPAILSHQNKVIRACPHIVAIKLLILEARQNNEHTET